MGAPTSTTLGVFGYLPGQPDFVRVRAAGREVRRLEEWLERGLHQARWEMGGGFSVSYPRLFHRFVFRPDNSERVVAGILCASVDCHQRPFPFVAFDLVPTALWDRAPAAFVGRNSGFFAAMERLVRTLGPLPHIGQVHGQLVGTQAAPLLDDAQGDAEDRAAEESRYLNFLQETACSELGAPGQGAGLALCHELIGLVGSGQDPRLLRQALLLPLCRPPFARELEIRFYLSFLLTLLAAQRPTVTMLWQLGGAAPGALTLSFREPSFDVFSALLSESGGARGVHRLGATTTTTTAPLSRPRPELTDATSLHTLLEVLAGKTQRPDIGLRGRTGNGT